MKRKNASVSEGDDASKIAQSKKRPSADCTSAEDTMGAQGGKPGQSPTGPVVQPTEDDFAVVPPFFAEILRELSKVQADFGGTRNFRGAPEIDHKVQRKEFQASYTDYEYIYLTVLGFARLHVHVEEIVGKMNGKDFRHNPGVQMLERVCGMTMHGDREGAKNLVRSAPASLLEAFAIAKTRRSGLTEFFRGAFDRTADPCLEGRLGRLMEYLEAKRSADCEATGIPPWEDVSLKPLKPDAAVRDVVGEHLRVFMGECTWTWSRNRGMTYEAAKTARDTEEHSSSFATVFNEATFEACLVSKGVAAKPQGAMIWEAMGDKGWSPYDQDVSLKIEQDRARGKQVVEVRFGPKGWKYEIDLKKNVQRNPKTGTERPVRCVPASASSAKASGQGFPIEDLRREIQYFVNLCTLPAAPATNSSTSSPVEI
mmetsp:Transcript_90714/g.142435  ORF Transcript_90714/g.142435 Transcript_90714/m.142435 type:complete len:426 (+) Transcript_90714:56-1333(+)